ncbi:MAG: hypothetical protein J1E64_01545 [Acetatifactor sp.]|nr:hypothetical protein [Acetatifactor sp.]
MMKVIDRRKIAVSIMLSFAFAVMQIAGYQISMTYNTSVHRSAFFQNIGVLSKVQCILFGIIEGVFWSVILYLLFTLLERIKFPVKEHCGRINILLWFLVSVLMFACWIPCFLAGYPGFYNYDAFSQVPQALYEEVQYYAHHPLIHTLVMGKIIAFGYHHGVDLNDGIALHSITQMAFCALVFSYILCYLRKRTGRLWFCIVAFCYYAFFPLIPMFAMSTTKDTIFSALLLLTVILLHEMCMDMTAFFASKWNVMKFVVISLLMCLFRKNGIYAVVCAVPFIIFLYRKYWRQILLLFGAITILSVASNRGLMWILHADAGSAEEMFSVPMQQIARVYNDYGEEAFEEEELEMIYEGISEDDLLNYDPFLSDHIKNYFDFNVILDNKMDYLLLWVKKGMQYPGGYWKAFLENTYQAWYPGTSIYNEPYADQTFYFDMGMWPGGYRDTKMPGLLNFYEKISTEIYYQKFPILRLFFSIGAMFWVTLFVFGFAVYQKNRPMAAAMLLVLTYCLTVLMGPISLVRYYLVLFYGFPVSIGYLLSGYKQV